MSSNQAQQAPQTGSKHAATTVRAATAAAPASSPVPSSSQSAHGVQQQDDELQSLGDPFAGVGIDPSAAGGVHSGATTQLYQTQVYGLHGGQPRYRRGIRITHKLTATNYLVWKQSMTLALRSSGLLWTVETPAKQGDTAGMTQARTDAVFEIMNNIEDPSLLVYFGEDTTDPYTGWGALRARFIRVDSAHRGLALQALLGAKQTDTENHTEYALRLSRLRSDFMLCGGNAATAEDAHRGAILMGSSPKIREVLQTRVSMVEALGMPVPTIDLMLTWGRNAESMAHALSASGMETPLASFAGAAVTGKGDASSQRKERCFNCNKEGHRARKCPQPRKERFTANPQQVAKGMCPKEGHGGHKASECKGGRKRETKNPSGRPSHSSQPSAASSSPPAGELFDDDLSAEAHSAVCETPSNQFGGVALAIGVQGTRVPALLDSGANRTLVAQGVPLEDARPDTDSIVRVANGAPIKSLETGTLVLNLGDNKILRVKGALRSPEVTRSLISVHDLNKCEEVTSVSIDRSHATIYGLNNLELCKIPQQGGLYPLPLDSGASAPVDSANSSLATSSQSKATLLQVHQQLGHVALSTIKRLVSAGGMSDLIIEGSLDTPLECEACAKGKSKRNRFKDAIPDEHQATEAMELQVWDTAGPIPFEGLNGERYLEVGVDVGTGWYMLIPCTDKGKGALEVLRCIKQTCVTQRKQLKTYLSDGAKELSSGQLAHWLKDHGTRVLTRVPHTPQHTAKAERAIRSINELSTTMLLAAKAHRQFWPYAARHAVLVLNSTRLIRDTGKTPTELWTGKSPSLRHLHEWGCDVDTHEVKAPGTKHDKFTARSFRGMYLGMDDQSDFGHLVYDPGRFLVVRTRDITCHQGKYTVSQGVRDDITSGDDAEDHSVDFTSTEEQLDNEIELVKQISLEEARPHTASPSHTEPKSQPEETADSQTVSPADSEEEEEKKEDQPRRSGRASKPVLRYGMADPRDIGIAHVLHDPGLSSTANREAYTVTEIVEREPRTFAEAVKLKIWCEAIKKEILAIDENDTWVAVIAPPGANIATTKWVFRWKYKATGAIERAKARLTVRGFTQKYGVDYESTFAPVLYSTTLRVLVSLAAMRDYELMQIDVETAFLNAPVDKDIYIKKPDGVKIPPGHVLKLKKALYGIKQAPHCWHKTIHDFLTIDLGFKQCHYDQCLYTKESTSTPGRLIWFALYVDDGFIACHKDDYVQTRADLLKLKESYKIKGKREAYLILGMRVTRDRANGIIKLDQKTYVEQLVSEYGLTQRPHIGTPERASVGEASKPLHNDVVTPENYRTVVGSIQYLANATRPDISHAARELASHTNSPSPVHCAAALRVLLYLKGTAEQGLTLGKGDGNKLHAFADANWGSDNVNTAKANHGWAIKLGLGVVDWTSKQQPITALSTTEAEYIAYSATAQRLQWIRHVVMELLNVRRMRFPIKIYGDNKVAISNTALPTITASTRHLNRKFHHVRELVAEGIIKMEWIGTDKNQADIFTKALGPNQFKAARSMLLP